MKIKKLEIDNGLAKEIESIKKSMDSWTTLSTTTDTVVKTLIQYYYLVIGFPISQWSKAIKGDIREIFEKKFLIENKRIPKNEKELDEYIEGLSAKKRSN